MSLVRESALLVVRLLLASVAMVVAYVLSTTLIGQAGSSMTPEDAIQAGRALPLVATINALVLSYPILRSRWRGLRLIGAVALLEFGVETFMAQMETLYFNSAVQMALSMVLSIVAAGLLRALVFAPLAVLILGKLRGSALSGQRAIPTVPRMGQRFALLAVCYVVVYFVFGYFVAWQWAETRLFYTGTTAIKPFAIHFWDLFRTDPIILPFQLLRGALWTLLAVVVVRMMKAQWWEVSLAVGLTFAGLISSGIGLFPNPYMPAMVRQAHFFELSSSMLLFGGISGWVLCKRGG